MLFQSKRKSRVDRQTTDKTKCQNEIEENDQSIYESLRTRSIINPKGRY